MAYEQTSRGRRTEWLAGIDWRWAPLALVGDVLSYVVQTVRWQLLCGFFFFLPLCLCGFAMGDSLSPEPVSHENDQQSDARHPS